MSTNIASNMRIVIACCALAARQVYQRQVAVQLVCPVVVLACGKKCDVFRCHGP